MCTTYGCAQILDMMARIHLPAYAEAFPLSAWAVAARFGRLEEARGALRLMGRPSCQSTLAGAKRWDTATSKTVIGKRDKDLSDLPIGYLEKTPATSIRNFCAVRLKVVASAETGDYTWLHAANEFELW